MNSEQTPEEEYRCVCGASFAVSPGAASTCPRCSRTIRSESLQATLGATMYLSAKPQAGKAGPDETIVAGLSGDQVAAGEELLGKQLGHFLLQECLGGGGMGTVYRALDTSLQRYVAVKVLHVSGTGSTGSSSSSSGPERLMHEAIAQARLNHPNVVTVYYVGREGEMPFLAMELLPAGTLEERRELPFRELVHMASQVSSALDQSHRQGVVHGDLKPSNLLVADDGSIKLGDFGVAKISQSESRQGEGISGTPSYLAPELLDGEPASAQSDMYALGVTLFELSFGKLPYEFRGTTLREKLETHRTAEPLFPTPWPKSFPPDWRHLLKRLMAKDPAQRFESFDAVSQALHQIRPIEGLPAGRVSRTIAFLIDTIIALVCVIFVVLVSQGLRTGLGSQHQWWAALVGAGGAIALSAVIVAANARFGRLIGGYLMQLRAVDEHGLRPSVGELWLRSALRNGYLLLWTVHDTLNNLGMSPPTLMLLASGVWVAIDAFPFVIGVFGWRAPWTVHDYLSRTFVILDHDAFERQHGKA